MDTLHRVTTEDPVPPSKVAPGVPRDLETVALKCLAKEPAGRYASALGLAQDLERYRAGEPILARREGLARKVWRKARQRAALLAVGVVAAAALGAAGWAALDSGAARRTAALTRQFNDGLAAADWSPARRDELERVAARLGEKDPAAGQAARHRLLERSADQVRDALRRPRVTRDDVPPLEEEVGWLSARDPDQAALLRKDLAGRLRDWQPLFELAAPFADAAAVFPPGAVRVEAAGLRRIDPGIPVVPTAVPSRGQVRVTAEFAGDWEGGRELGVVVHYPAGPASGGPIPGYGSTVVSSPPPAVGDDAPTRQVGPAANEPPDFRRTGRHAELRITRNGTVLQRRAVTLTAGAVRVLAERVGDQLRAQVNDLPAITFTDAVPLVGDDRSVFGFIWPVAGVLSRVRADGSAVPPAASPLEKADELYDRGRLADALPLYEEQARAGGEAAAEARCKTGLCLAGLNRPDEAAKAFEAVVALPGDRWPVVAAAQLWLIRLREKRFADADAAFAAVSVRFTPEQLAQYVPDAVREEIVRSDDIPVVNFLLPDPKIISRLEAVGRLQKLLTPRRGAGDAYSKLVVALAPNREYGRAAPLAEQNIRQALDASGGGMGDSHVHWFLR